MFGGQQWHKIVQKDVKLVPDIILNLISTSKLDDEGFTTTSMMAK